MHHINKQKNDSYSIKENIKRIWLSLNALSKESLPIPKLIEFDIDKRVGRASSAADSESNETGISSAAPTPPVIMLECGICRQNKNQHQLALCDSCKLHYHLYCLDPPLTRMPKKTRFGGWQVS